MRACWWPSPARVRRCGSGTTGSARRSWAGWTLSGSSALQLAMARRLAAVPELFAIAAEQYLPAVGAVTDAAERRQVAGLLRRAAGQATLTGDYALANALLTAALAVVDPGETAHARRGPHRPSRRALLPGTAGGSGRGVPHDRTAVPRHGGPLGRDGAAGAQPDQPEPLRRGDRARPQSLRELGISIPPAERLPAELDRQFDRLVPVAGPNRSRRRPDATGHHRPYAARRVRSDQRGPVADLLGRLRHQAPG